MICNTLLARVDLEIVKFWWYFLHRRQHFSGPVRARLDAFMARRHLDADVWPTIYDPSFCCGPVCRCLWSSDCNVNRFRPPTRLWEEKKIAQCTTKNQQTRTKTGLLPSIGSLNLALNKFVLFAIWRRVFGRVWMGILLSSAAVSCSAVADNARIFSMSKAVCLTSSDFYAAILLLYLTSLC
ncbi:hypothetical protein T4D_4058 [Trichinella pseudospiralis]|uniref:Uncharacterized protein n=1 Tax=Trichinella pseudospiralis TaxID=6337 RepID=A0A0V1FH12_TRIPS|nr:hypothetical protein T4D_4058 [Trichinella pseudospiralis]